MWGYAPGVHGGVTADPGSPRRQQGPAQPPRLHRSGRTPDMTGYLIADVADVKDASLYQRYKPLVPASLQAFNGTYLTRGGSVTVLEGSWHPERIVVVLRQRGAGGAVVGLGRIPRGQRTAAGLDRDEHDRRRGRGVSMDIKITPVSRSRIANRRLNRHPSGT